jgi:indolepyruvate ferredoxin oxidoreductase
LLRTLSAANLVQAVAIASIPEQIRGFGHVKDASLKAARAKWAGLMATWRGGGERRAA